VENQILQGVMIGIIGMAILFAAMGVLILAMTLLEWLFRNRTEESEKTLPDERPAVSSLQWKTKDEEIAAAIATALAYLYSLEICESGLGSTLEAKPSSWWAVGRAHQSPANALKINHWRNW
jgi:sodium pump decarboxylase gamma subunit